MKKRKLFKKEAIITYLFITAIIGIAFLLLYFIGSKFTGFVVYQPGDIEEGSYWRRYFHDERTQSLKIYNTPINYYNGSDYTAFNYGPCGSNCFRDWNGLIYRVSSDSQKAYINLYDIDDNLLSRFGFGITGEVGGTNYKYTTLNFTWIWSQENIGEEYVFRAWNNKTNFNWTQEFYFYPNQSMKIKHIVANNLANINNAKFWYIQVVDEGDGIWFNGTKYTQDTYRTGEFDSLLPKVKFEEDYVFEYSDLLENGFNITDFYLGNGILMGVDGIRILAIGITKGNSIFPIGTSVSLDPTIKSTGQGADAYVLQGQPNNNYGSDTDLITKWGGADRKNSYLKFNISSIPDNQIIDNATLCVFLYNDRINDVTISSYHVYSDWQEDTITWNNQPCGTEFDNLTNCNLSVESSLSNDGNQDNTWQCWSIMNMVSKEYNDNNNEVSVVLHAENDTTYADFFYSKEYSSSSLWPYLNITYHTANIAPSVNIAEPQNQLYTNNESLSLNFSVSDSDANLDSCWYNIDDGQNTTITNCQNTTFNVSEGSHTLMIYVNDTLGLESSDNVSFNVDLTGVSISISEPTGTKTSRTEISFSFSVVGSNVSCIYNVYRGTSVEVANTSVDCSSGSVTGSFGVTVDADFTFNVYVNNTFGSSDSDSSSFSVSTSTSPPVGDGSGGSSGGGSSGGSSGGSMVVPRLKIEPISNLIADSGDSKKLRLRVENAQVKFIEDCRVLGDGNYSDWFSSTGIKGLAGGESHEFLIDLNIPEKLEAGIYNLSLKVVCEGVSGQVFFNLEIIEKKLEFDLIKVERIEKDQVKIIYSLEELSGLEQDVELQFLLFGYNNQKISEVRETKNLPSNTKEQFEVLIPIDSSLEGELSLLINLNSEVYSTFVEESITLGAFRTGFAIFGDTNRGDNLISGLLILLFLVFAFFIIRKILKLKKIKKNKKK